MIRLDDPVFGKTEIEQIVSWLNDPALMKHSEQRHSVHTYRTQLVYIHSFKEPNVYLKVMEGATLLGTVNAWIDIVNGVADLGILIGHPGKGYGCEAWRLLCHALTKRGVIRKIEGGCMAENKAMIRVFEKNYMRLEGTRKHHFLTPQGSDHLLLYGKLI